MGKAKIVILFVPFIRAILSRGRDVATEYVAIKMDPLMKASLSVIKEMATANISTLRE
jgi:hypothetical protein